MTTPGMSSASLRAYVGLSDRDPRRGRPRASDCRRRTPTMSSVGRARSPNQTVKPAAGSIRLSRDPGSGHATSRFEEERRGIPYALRTSTRSASSVICRKGLARRAAVVADSYACLTSKLRTLPSSASLARPGCEGRCNWTSLPRCTANGPSTTRYECAPLRWRGRNVLPAGQGGQRRVRRARLASSWLKRSACSRNGV